MDYQWAVGWLQAQTRGGRPRGPERARGLLQALALDELNTHFVHVVGTNGKGSVAAYLEAAFIEAGTGGSFTSPHMISLRERVRCKGENVPQEEVVSFTRKVHLLDVEPRPAFFDLMLGLALECFESHGVDWAALEAGVGGASDATMSVGKVEAVVLTNVAADHLQTFGGMEALARDKAGAARPGVPLITAANGRMLEIVSGLARQKGAPLYVYDPSEALFSLPAEPALAGSFQRINAALAVAALRLLGFGEKTIETAIREARLPGRLQRLQMNGVDVYLDGAHNPPAAAALAAELPGFHLVFGAHQRKDVLATLEPLLERAASVTYTWPLDGAPPVHPAPYIADPVEALATAAQRTGEEKEPVLVTGSFYLVGRLLGCGLLQ